MNCLSFVVATAGMLPSAGSDPDGDLAACFKSYLQETVRHRPLAATRLGDHSADHLLDDLSAEARAAWMDLVRRTLEELPRRVDYAKLSRGAQIDFEIFRHHLARDIWLAENVRPFETDPRLYNEYTSDAVFLLLTQSSLPRERNIANAAARMAFIPKITAAARANLRNPPRVVVETAIRQNRGAIAFFERGIFEVAGVAPGAEPLATPAKRAVAALADYGRFLEGELLPRAEGEWRLGKEKFSARFEMDLDAGLTADEAVAEAEGEFRRLEGELYTLSRQLWSRLFAGKPLPPDDEPGRREVVRAVLAEAARDHGRPEDLVRDAVLTIDSLKTFITARDILRLPEVDRCRIVEMPEFQRGNSVAYLNSAPPLDPTGASIYAISPPPRDWSEARVNTFLEEYNRRMLRILSIHEGYPGHYVQLEYANRHPSLIRRVLSSDVYAEGWAVYTEQMMLDEGYGDGDLLLRLQQLKFHLRAVANAILDHRMHCSGMTDAQAMALLTERAFQSEGEARLKIIRAKQTSVQLSSYFVGRRAFSNLRRSVQRELGEAFRLGRFHEAVLECGGVPIKYLPELVRAAPGGQMTPGGKS